MTAIRATFTKFLDVPSRKIVQIVLEIPSEAADDALAKLGGWPRPDESRWVAVVRLTEEAATRPAEDPHPTDDDLKKWGEVKALDGKPRRPMAELGFVMQAGILCNDAQFQKFCGCDDKLSTAAFVRSHCGIGSRTELETDKDGRTRWDQLRSEFDASIGRIGRPE